MAMPTEVPIAGVPWPLYKLASLVIGALVLMVIAVAGGTAATAVLTGAGVATAMWVTMGIAMGSAAPGRRD